MSARGNVALAAGIPVTRAISWGPLAGGSVVALMVVAWARMGDAGTAGLIGALRVGAVLLAAGAAFALDDPAATTLAGSPTPLSVRRLLRLGLALSACVGAWTAMLVVAGGPAHSSAAGLTLEAAGMLAVALAAASLAAPRIANGLGGLVGGPALVSFLLATMIVQQYRPQWAFLAFPGTPAWEAAQVRWLVVAGAGSAVVALAGLDPARRPVTTRQRSRRRGRPPVRRVPHGLTARRHPC